MRNSPLSLSDFPSSQKHIEFIAKSEIPFLARSQPRFLSTQARRRPHVGCHIRRPTSRRLSRGAGAEVHLNFPMKMVIWGYTVPDIDMGMDQYLLIPFLGGWTSINPSYFDVNRRGTRFWHTAIYPIFRHTQKPPITDPKWRDPVHIARLLGGYLIFGEGIIQIDDKEYPSYWSKWRLRTNSGLTLPWWALQCNWMCSPRVSKLTHTEDGVWTSWSDDHSGNWSMRHGIASVGRLADPVMLATAASSSGGYHGTFVFSTGGSPTMGWVQALRIISDFPAHVPAWISQKIPFCKPT